MDSGLAPSARPGMTGSICSGLARLHRAGFVLGPLRQRAVVERHVGPAQHLGEDEPVGRGLVAGIAIVDHRLCRHVREQLRELGLRLERLRIGVERGGVIEQRRARKAAGPRHLLRLGGAGEIIGGTAIEQHRAVACDRGFHVIERGAQRGDGLERIGRPGARRAAGAGLDRARRIAPPTDHATGEDGYARMTRGLQGPVDAGSGAEIADRSSGRDDDRMVTRREAEAAEQMRERIGLRQQACCHALGRAPAILGIVLSLIHI